MAGPRGHVRTQMLWVAVMDLACLVVGGVVGIMLRFGHEEIREYVFARPYSWLLLFGSVLLANYLAGSYQLQFTFSRFNLVVTWAFSIVFALLILGITSYAWFVFMLGRGVLLLTLATYSLLSLALRLVIYRRLFRSEGFICRVAVLGPGRCAEEAIRILENSHVLPAHRVVACVEIERNGIPAPARLIPDRIPVIQTAADKIVEKLKTLDVRLLVLAPDNESDLRTIFPQLRKVRFQGIEVLSRLALAEIYTGRTPLELVTEEALMEASLQSGLPAIRRVKRLLDIVLSAVACVVLVPVVLLLVIVMKLSAPRSPVFYTQIRVGRFGVPFRIVKFRTMRENAEDESGPVWSAPNDDRITRLGRILRRFRLDEIPQLFNVLKGEMSLVGPRPERPEIGQQLSKVLMHYAERVNVPPGLTGWAQIRYPYGSSVEDAARKLEYDLYYIKHLSLTLDLQILLSTVRIVLLGKERTV
ncbi:MAG: exopolysaccharide biosynthesis polyprenyl glycosylphosphotransferase [Kiritimatiellae bacterium]|nr:exopolysaccharide biosynthesis polyprenyl glycosylphosphotransferase [Kiritimatiellia bacterium]